MHCSIESGQHDGFPVMFVRGELGHAMCPEFESNLARFVAPPALCVILDLIDVPYTQAAPLRVVLETHRALRARGGAMAVVCCTEYMTKLVEVCGADEELHLFHTMDLAAAHLSAVCERA